MFKKEDKNKINEEKEPLIQHSNSFFRRSSCINLTKWKQFYQKEKRETKENDFNIKILKIP